MNTLWRINGKELLKSNETKIVMELGVTFEGDISIAKKMIDACAENLVDAVKIEAINPDKLVAKEYKNILEYSYSSYSGKDLTENYYELLEKVKLSYSQIEELKSYADKKNITFFGTAFDLETVDFFKSINCCAVKISSGELTHTVLLEHAAKSGLQVIFDTGRSQFQEIVQALEVLRNNGCQVPILMHNPSGYPAPPSKVNLPIIDRYKRTLEVPVGFSCHTRGFEMSLGAVALGASIIEKPISRDNTQDFDEHIFAVNIHELHEFVAQINNVKQALQSPSVDQIISYMNNEKERYKFRQSLVAKRKILKGESINLSNVTFARPGYGIKPIDFKNVLGCQIITDIEEGQLITYSMLMNKIEIEETV